MHMLFICIESAGHAHANRMFDYPMLFSSALLAKKRYCQQNYNKDRKKFQGVALESH